MLHEKDDEDHEHKLSRNEVDIDNNIENYNCDFNYYYMSKSIKEHKRKLVSFCY